MSKYHRPISRQQRLSYKVAYDPQNPRAIGNCDGCDFPVPHFNLRKHMRFQGGDVPVWDGLLVCPNCDDKPNPFFKRQVLPPDPVPIRNPRPDTSGNTQFLATEEDDPIVTGDLAVITTEDGEGIITEDGIQIGTEGGDLIEAEKANE